MELPAKFSSLRKLVLESNSPELRQLESQLLQSFANQQNHRALADKAVKEKNYAAAQLEYATLEQQQWELQQEQCRLHHDKKRTQASTLALHQQEQAANRQVMEDEQRCRELLMDVALARDVTKEVQEEKRKATSARQEAAEAAARHLDALKRQQAAAAIREQEQEQQLHRAASLSACTQQLQQSVQLEEAARTRLQHDSRAARLGIALQQHDALVQEVRDLRASVDEAEQWQHQRRMLEQREHDQQHRQLQLADQLRQQMRDKAVAAEREKRQEAEYLLVLREVQQLECDLQQLTAAARRRRQLQQRHETDQLLQVRRLQRQQQQLLEQHEDQLQQQYTELRWKERLEEERALLLQFAPHLLPHLTPALANRLAAIPLLP